MWNIVELGRNFYDCIAQALRKRRLAGVDVFNLGHKTGHDSKKSRPIKNSEAGQF